MIESIKQTALIPFKKVGRVVGNYAATKSDEIVGFCTIGLAIVFVLAMIG